MTIANQVDPSNRLTGNSIHAVGWRVAAQQLLSGGDEHSFGKLDDKETATLTMLVEVFTSSGPTTAEEETGRADAVFWAGIGATGALMGAVDRCGCDVGKVRAALVLIYPDQPIT